MIALILYLFGWSDLYPHLTASVVSFLAITIVLSGGLGVWLWKKRKVVFTRIQVAREKYPLIITAFIFALWIVEFMYAGGIPLFKILLNQPYDYRTFGVPTLHVFVVTFSSFYTVYLLHLYLSRRSQLLLFLFLINLSAAVLIYNRGMLLFNLCGATSIYLINQQQITFRQAITGFLFVLSLLYVFGVLGSLRVSRQARKPYTNRDFLNIGRATNGFRESFVPDEFFWAYIYVSSPIANLQHNINSRSVPPITLHGIGRWFTNEVLPDFISKRINRITRSEPISEDRIPGPFNATTIYSRSYSYLGWPGLFLMTGVILLLPVIYFKLLPRESPFFLTAVALLNTVFLFSVFVNTISFTGLSFQLAYPLVLHYLPKRLIALRRIFVNNKVTAP